MRILALTSVAAIALVAAPAFAGQGTPLAPPETTQTAPQEATVPQGATAPLEATLPPAPSAESVEAATAPTAVAEASEPPARPRANRRRQQGTVHLPGPPPRR